jgi:hypothetical protein
MPAIATSTATFTVRPFVKVVPVGTDDAAELIERVATALDGDPRAIAPAVGYDYTLQRLDAIFQVEVEHVDAGDPRSEAVTLTLDIFDCALRTAGFPPCRTDGWSIVDGDDPDLLP